MKDFKRLLSGVLCAVMLVASTGCGPAANTTPDTPPVDTATTTEQGTHLRFYLVRHGKTYTNIKEMSIASAGSAPLTAEGRAFAYYAGLGLKEEGTEFLAAYCSPLNRTRETAQYVLAGLGADMPITVENNVRDINWGAMEASYPEEYEEIYGREGNDYNYFLGRYQDQDFVSPVEGAESTYEFAERFEQGLRNIADQHKGESGNILVAAHSTIGFYVTKFTGEDAHGVPNTSVTIVDYADGAFTLVTEGDKSYMENGEAIYDAKQPLEIYLVTSPQTILQSRNVLEGGIDTNLLEAGQDAAKKVPDIVGGTPLAIYSSDQGRSRTARALAYPDMENNVIETAALNDLFLGFWEGEKVSTLQETAAEDYARLTSSNNILSLTPRVGEGEAPMYASARLDGVLDDIAFQYQASEGKVVVFTHPYIIKCYLNNSFPAYTVPVTSNAQVFKLTYKDNAFAVADVQEVA